MPIPDIVKNRPTLGNAAPRVCQYCQSPWFFEATVGRYKSQTYSNTPGGDISPISGAAYRLLICPCGAISTPNLSGVRTTEAESNVGTLKGAIAANHHLFERLNTLEQEVRQLKSHAENKAKAGAGKPQSDDPGKDKVAGK